FLIGFEALRRCGTGVAVAAALPLACALGSRVRFQARPEAAAMVVFAAAFFLLLKDRFGEDQEPESLPGARLGPYGSSAARASVPGAAGFAGTVPARAACAFPTC